MQRKIGIIIMLSAFSVSAMAGGEVRLGKNKAYDNEYELVVEHEGNEEVLMSLEPDLIIVADWLSKRITDIGAITGAKVYFYKTPNSYEEQK